MVMMVVVVVDDYNGDDGGGDGDDHEDEDEDDDGRWMDGWMDLLVGSGYMDLEGWQRIYLDRNCYRTPLNDKQRESVLQT